MGRHSDISEDSPFEGAASGVTERKYVKPFGMNGRYNTMMKEEALRVLSRQECFDRGFLTVRDLDDEELVNGRCRDKTGKIPKVTGKTDLIPREQYDAMVAEHELRYKQRLRERLDSMITVMVDIAEDDTVEPRDRLEAAKYIFERTAGKTPETVTVNVKHAPWEDLLSQVAGIAPMSRAEHRELGVGIVDAEVVDEVDDEYWTEGDVLSRANLQQERDVDGQRSDVPVDAERSYGRRADEKRSYAEQAQDAQDLAKRRKEAKAKIQNAKKQRKIDRALGADAITDEITGAELGEDGKVTFEQA